MRYLGYITFAVLFVLGVVAFLLTGKRTFIDLADRQVEVIEAETEVARRVAEAAKQAELQELQQRYAKELRQLEETNHAEVARLRENPRKLTRVLARMAARKEA